METLEQPNEQQSIVPPRRRGRPRKDREEPDQPPRRRGPRFTPVRSLSRLRQFRLAANMTQRQLAERIGVAQASIAQAEIIGTGFGDEKWEELAAIFKTDVLEIRGWKKIYAK